MNMLSILLAVLIIAIFGTCGCEKRKPKNLLKEYIERIDLDEEDVLQTTCSKKGKNTPDKDKLHQQQPQQPQQPQQLQHHHHQQQQQQQQQDQLQVDITQQINKHLKKALGDIKIDNKYDDLNNDNSNHNFTRISLPKIARNFKINQRIEAILPGDVEVNITVLSSNPFIFEVDGLLDDEECDVLVAIAKSKTPKPIKTLLNPLQIKSADKTFREWDYDQNGYVTYDEILLLPSLADIKFSDHDVDDMFFVLKMDQNKDGKIELDELRKTDLSQIDKYIDSLRADPQRLRNMTSHGSWVWADEDDMLKYEEHGYFEKYHKRLSTVTEIPAELWELSEPLQVKNFLPGQFQAPRQDSEPVNKDIPCCLYGDINKRCRVCRYLSFNLFLNDVEEGGELVFPLANHPFQNVMENSGEWRGYYMYSKTTGNKFYFSVNMTFQMFGANRGFSASGAEENGEFVFKNSIITEETVSFEKVYNTETDSGNVVRYQGKIIENTRVSGYWWIPGQKRMHGIFFMWNHAFEIYSSRAVDQSNRNDGCLKSELRIKSKKGKAVFWYNHHLHPLSGMVGQQNQESITAQCEVTKGEKWIASSWLNIIGDGELTLRAWRRGSNLLREAAYSNKIFKALGTDKPKLDVEPYEREYYQEIYGNGTQAQDSGYHKYKPASSALQALNLLMNDLSSKQLSVLATTVHRILGIQCVPTNI